jgi:hypothetical protein
MRGGKIGENEKRNCYGKIEKFAGKDSAPEVRKKEIPDFLTQAGT